MLLQFLIRARSLVFVMLLLLTGCDAAEDSGWRVERGALIFYADSARADVSSDTVSVGEPVKVSVTTFGGGCTKAAGIGTEVRKQTAVLIPLDSVYSPSPGEACTEELRRHQHAADVIFSHVGPARLLIHGKAVNFKNEKSDVVLRQNVYVVSDLHASSSRHKRRHLNVLLIGGLDVKVEDEAAVRAREEAYRAGWLANDSAAVMATLAPGAVMMPGAWSRWLANLLYEATGGRTTVRKPPSRRTI